MIRRINVTMAAGATVAGGKDGECVKLTVVVFVRINSGVALLTGSSGVYWELWAFLIADMW